MKTNNFTERLLFYKSFYTTSDIAKCGVSLSKIGFTLVLNCTLLDPKTQ